MNTNKRGRRARSNRMRRRSGRWWQRHQHQDVAGSGSSELVFSEEEILLGRLLEEGLEAAKAFDLERLGSIFSQLDKCRRQKLKEAIETSLWLSGIGPEFWLDFSRGD